MSLFCILLDTFLVHFTGEKRESSENHAVLDLKMNSFAVSFFDCVRRSWVRGGHRCGA